MKTREYLRTNLQLHCYTNFEKNEGFPRLRSQKYSYIIHVPNINSEMFRLPNGFFLSDICTFKVYVFV